MKRICLPILFFCLALSTLTASATSSSPAGKREYHAGDRIAIVGAGVCGLAIARTLLDQGVDGHKITVLDKEDQPGGKVKTVMVDGRPVELGAQVVVPGVYGPILDLIAKYHLGMHRPGDGGSFNLQTGEFASALDLSTLPEFLSEMAIYEFKYLTEWSSISDPKGLADIPDELKVSWPEFVKQQGFQAIDVNTAGFIGGSGYLREDALPQAAQMVRMLTPYNLTSLGLNGTRILDDGYQQLWKLEAADLQKSGITFLLNTAVNGISRAAKTTLLQTDKKTLEVEHVFYTGNLAFLPMLLTDATTAEKSLYSRVVNNDYRSYILRVSGLANQGMSGSFGFVPNTVTAPLKHAVLSVKPYEDSNVDVFYAYGTPEATDAEIIAGIGQDLGKLNARVDQVIAAQKWTYFPHVTSDLQGFFRGVMQAEGVGGVWIAGEATSFTATIEVYKQGRDFVLLFVQNKL